jgi:hypothetical protein
MTTNDKTDSSIPSGTGGAAAPRTDATASSKTAAKKKNQQQQQKNQKANPLVVKKKQQPQVGKSAFDNIASGVSPMKGIVIAHGNGNLAGQFRVFQEKLAGAAANDKAYGLDSAILDLILRVKSDFVQPKTDPRVHSRILDIMEVDDKGLPSKIPTGEKKLMCFDPIMKD